MRKLLTALQLIAALAFILGFAVRGSYAGGPASIGENNMDNVLEVVGTQVKNPQGEDLGRISGVVIASEGRAAFAVLSCASLRGEHEKLVAIPLDALKLDPGAKYFMLNISKERLESAPVFDKKDAMSLKWSENTERYYGQQPYWTEEGGSGPSIEQPTDEKKLRNSPSDYEEIGMRLDLGLA